MFFGCHHVPWPIATTIFCHFKKKEKNQKKDRKKNDMPKKPENNSNNKKNAFKKSIYMSKKRKKEKRVKRHCFSIYIFFSKAAQRKVKDTSYGRIKAG